MPQPQPKPLPFPVSGLHEDGGYNIQPPLTTNDLLNVRSHDPIKNRIRGGSRPGLGKFHSSAINGIEAIQHIIKVTRPVVYVDLVGTYVTAFTNTQFSGAINEAGTSTFTYSTGEDAGAIDRDDSGNYYIAGVQSTTWTGNDGTNKNVWKVSEAGTVLWSYYDTSSLELNSIVYDRVNDVVYITGPNNLVEQLNASTGAQNWTVNLGFTMHSMVVDSTGNLFVVGGRNNSWAGATKQANVFKIDSAGTILAAYDTGDSNPLVIDVSATGQILVGQVATSTTWEGNDSSAKNVFLLDNDISTTPVNTFNISATTLITDIKFMKNGTYLLGGALSATKTIYNFNSSGSTVWSFKASGFGCIFDVDDDDNVVVLADPNILWDGQTGSAELFVLNGLTGAVITNSLADTDYSPATPTPAAFLVKPASVQALSTREASVITVAGGTVKKLLEGTLTTPTSGSSAFTDELYRVNGVQLNQAIFYVDGTNSKFYNLVADEVFDWATNMDAGTLPASCRLIARYRGRIVLSGKQSDPANWFMSKVGNGKDFDFTPAVTTAIQAVAGNASEVGLVGDIVTALMPFNDDAMLIGGDQSLWQMSGDPAAGGSIDLVSDKIGVAWNAWTQDPDGAIYFLGNDGLYRIARGELPIKITSNRLDERFRQINLGAIRCFMAWDIVRHGLVITLAVPTTSVQTSYFWDSRTDAWTIDNYPAAYGPSYLYAYDSERADDSDFFLGCKDGFIRNIADSASDDDGIDITTRVRYQPLMLTDGRSDGILQYINVVMAVGSSAVTLKVYTGQTAEECMTSTTVRYAKALNAGRNPISNQNIRGKYAQIELSSTTASRWAVESVEYKLRPSGGGRHSR